MPWTNEQNESYRSFSDAAEQYCAYVESLTEGRPEKFFHRLRSLLSRLVWVLEDLRVNFVVTDRIETSPTLEVSDDDYFKDVDDSRIDLQALFTCLQNMIGPEVELRVGQPLAVAEKCPGLRRPLDLRLEEIRQAATRVLRFEDRW